jgi:DNA-directed RNA polymerase specialized sigma24 family protein
VTQTQWDSLAQYARALGYAEPEDAVQDCLLEDLGKHGQVTSYTSWLLVRRIARTSPYHEVPLVEALDIPTEINTDHIDLSRMITVMERHPNVFSYNQMSVFVLRCVGHTYQDIATIHRVTKQRVKQIESWVIGKLRRYVK